MSSSLSLFAACGLVQANLIVNPSFESGNISFSSDGYFLTAPTSISFRLRNPVIDPACNDFAVDSLYFGLSTNAPSYPANAINSIGAITGGAAVPEPGTWAAAALLAGGAAFLRWRKRRGEAQKEAA